MTIEQIEKMRAIASRALQLAAEVDALADGIENYAEQHDSRETARIIRDEAEVVMQWMNLEAS